MPARKKSAGNGELVLMLGQIDGKLDSLTETMRQHAEHDRETFTRIFERLEDVPRVVKTAVAEADERVKEVISKADERVGDIDARVGALESLRLKVVGGAVALGALATGAAKLLEWF